MGCESLSIVARIERGESGANLRIRNAFAILGVRSGEGAQKEEQEKMTRKSTFALAAILAVGSLSLSLAPDAFAAHGGGHGGGGHGGGGHMGGGHGGGHFGGGHFGGGHFGGRVVGGGHSGGHFGGRHGPHVGGGHPAHFVRGHNRHFWHGRWWAYGVGPCWVWSDDYAEYVWVCF
jgi:hypothetical protein